jgi:transposase
MNEIMRQEIVQRRQAGTSQRGIAAELGISRGAVTRVLSRLQAQRDGQAGPPVPRRPSLLDPFEPLLKELLQRYPKLTVQRALQELRSRGYEGGYTILRLRLRQMRPGPPPRPVVRFETGPGVQAQMDYGVYDLDFAREGRRRVYLFSYVLAYSRRQYMRFVESMDLPTTLREHVHAFHHLGGVARVCLYDNFKVVVLRHDADGPLYNPKFLAFATHYGFQPRACQVRRPQTKGKVERRFAYVETSLLNGRDFETLEHLNEVTAWWLDNIADTRVLRDFKETPRQRYEREQALLLPLPAADFDTAQVFYRHVNVDGFVAVRSNFYSVPWSYIGQVLPVRITENEIIIYSVTLEEIARHALLGGEATGERQLLKSHHPSADAQQRVALLRQRYQELGPSAEQFLDGLLARQVQGKQQAQQLLALLGQYQRDDVLQALERAVRFGAYSLAAVRRILAAQAQPKPRLDELAELYGEALDPSLRQDPIGPRPTSDYQELLESGDSLDETEKEAERPERPEEADDQPEPS